MSEFEQIELLLQLGEGVNAQLEFWIGVTFAALIASYTAGDRLSPIARGILAVLYVTACVIFYLRIGSMTSNSGAIAALLNDMGSTWLTEQAAVVQPARRTLMIVGTILGTILIAFPRIAKLRKIKSEDT